MAGSNQRITSLQNRLDHIGRDRRLYLAPGQHLLYCNTKVPTEQLLPDGTDNAFSPPAPWTNRLWAGGRIRFLQPHGLELTGSPRMILAEYVRDVRITGREGQEKIFVKIERRVGELKPGLPWSKGLAASRDLMRVDENDTRNSIILETRDLCFLREAGSAVAFQRRYITPPTKPDYSHSLTPTPALLFRFSALTNNAHAIHIDPEYTRNVYGFPNLLVHGPLALALMLEYVRQVLLRVTGLKLSVPIVTEIDYRNLAPLFANEEMTICVKTKGYVGPDDSSPKPPGTEESDEKAMDGESTPSVRNDESVASSERESHEPEDTSPPRAISTESGFDIGKGFPTPPSEEEVPVLDEQEDDPESESKPATPMSPKARRERKALIKEKFPQEWEVWIQTGRGDEASLAVRGTVKIEMIDRPKKSPPTESTSTEIASTRSAFTEEEVEILQKVKDMLVSHGKRSDHGQTHPENGSKLIRKRFLSPRKVSIDKLIRKRYTGPSKLSTNTEDVKISHSYSKLVVRRPLRSPVRPHNSKIEDNVKRGVGMYDIRHVESGEDVRPPLEGTAFERTLRAMLQEM